LFTTDSQNQLASRLAAALRNFLGAQGVPGAKAITGPMNFGNGQITPVKPNKGSQTNASSNAYSSQNPQSLSAIVQDHYNMGSYDVWSSSTITYNVTAGQACEFKVLEDLSARATGLSLFAPNAQGQKYRFRSYKKEFRVFLSSATRLSFLPVMYIILVKMPSASVFTDPTECTTAQLTAISGGLDLAIAGNHAFQTIKRVVAVEQFHYDQAGSTWTYEFNFTINALKNANKLMDMTNKEVSQKALVATMPTWSYIGMLHDNGQGVNWAADWRLSLRYYRAKQDFV
jgi:hypothetical protein